MAMFFPPDVTLALRLAFHLPASMIREFFTARPTSTMLRTTLATLAFTASLPAAIQNFQTFEGDGFDTWKTEGDAFGLAPVAGNTEGMKTQLTGYSGESLAVSSNGGTTARGTLISPEFTIQDPFITFLIAGGSRPGKTAVQLLVDGKVVHESVGKCDPHLQPARWDVSRFKGRPATIQLVDEDEAEWGFIAVDQIMFTDDPNQKFPVTTSKGKAVVDGLVETETLAGVSIPSGSLLKVEASFEDHQLASPTAITFDEQGRIYAAETHRFREGVEDDRDHLYWYLDDLAAMKTSDRRALHDKWKDKVSLEHLTAKSEVIRRLADTDGDGKIDESKIFATGFNDVLDGTAAGVFFHEGFLYFACIPKIQMLRDADGDGVAEVARTVADGFGVKISLSGHDLNGFTLGPDGRIYGTVGDRGLSLVTKEGVLYDYPNEGAAFRFEPDGSGFEIFHTGLRNPKEIAFDALGNAFSVDNNSDQGDAARIVYLVEGGDSGWQMEHQAMHSFHRQIGLVERPPSRWMDERMWELQNPSQPAYQLPPVAHLTSGPSGLTYHPGAGFLESEAGRFLISDYRGGAANSGIWSFEMKPNGAGMEMTDSRRFAWGIAATDVEYSWDGRVFVSDFITGWASHEAGRLLSLDAGEKSWRAAEAASAAKLMKKGFEQRSSAELLNLLKHPDARIRLRAQISLTRKPDAFNRFTAATQSSDRMVRIHGIWGLGILSRRGPVPLAAAEFGDIPNAKIHQDAEKALIRLLADKDAEIRAQVLRSLADSKNDPNPIPLGPLLADESPRVRFFAALLAGKRKMIGYYGPICDLLQENDNRDVYLRHACVVALQGMAEKPAILTGLDHHESPAVRLAAVIALRRLKNPNVSLFVRDADPKVAEEAIRAICDLDIPSRRPVVAALLDDLSARAWSPFMLRRLVHNAYRVGTDQDAARLLMVAGNTSLPENVRLETLRLLGLWTEPFPVDQFTGHWRPLEKREEKAFRPALLAALPGLLSQQGSILTAALGLVKTYQLEIPTLDETALRAMATRVTLPAPARAAALELLILRKPENLADFLTTITADSSDEVLLTALAAMAKLAPAAALPALEAAVNSPSAPRAQKTWSILATLSGPATDAIFVKQLDALRTANGISPSAIELTAAAKSRKSPAVQEALGALITSLADSSDPLAKWNSSLEGGDPVSGAALFTSHPAGECKRCHRADAGHTSGGDTAPNLAGIAARHQDRRYFLESMVVPGAVIAPGFGSMLVSFKNGSHLTGHLITEATDHLDIDAAGKLLRVSRGDIATYTPPASPMPPMGELLKPEELRDVVAWLATLHQGGEAPKKVDPVLFDPASLLSAGKPPLPASHEGSAVDPTIMKLGKQQFMVCAACHGQSGEGSAAGPPIAGSEWVTGPAENLIRIQLRGLQGPIKVKGVEYDFPAGMAALAYQTDEQIAAVLTYIRNSFGNVAPAVAPAAVAALREEVGKPPVTAAGLLSPKVKTPASAASPEPTGVRKYDHLKIKSHLSKWIAGAVAALTLCWIGVMMLRKN